MQLTTGLSKFGGNGSLLIRSLKGEGSPPYFSYAPCNLYN